MLLVIFCSNRFINLRQNLFQIKTHSSTTFDFWMSDSLFRTSHSRWRTWRTISNREQRPSPLPAECQVSLAHAQSSTFDLSVCGCARIRHVTHFRWHSADANGNSLGAIYDCHSFALPMETRREAAGRSQRQATLLSDCASRPKGSGIGLAAPCRCRCLSVVARRHSAPLWNAAD